MPGIASVSAKSIPVSVKVRARINALPRLLYRHYISIECQVSLKFSHAQALVDPMGA
jgi:hypothetical protein